MGNEVAKLLVYTVHEKYLAYRLGKCGIYLSGFRVLSLSANPIPMQSPALAQVIYENREQLSRFLRDEGTLKIARVFKSIRYNEENIIPMPKGFMFNTVKNLLGLLKGKTIRIVSKDRKMADLFYAVCVSVNEENEFDCKFDFDEYDVVFEIRNFDEVNIKEKFVGKGVDRRKRKYPVKNGVSHLVTFIYGKDYPNLSRCWRWNKP